MLWQMLRGASSGDEFVAVTQKAAPYVLVYAWSDLGFGERYEAPSAAPAGKGNHVVFSPDGSAIAIAHDTAPYLTVYPWSSAGFGEKYPNPQVLPAGDCLYAAFNPDGTALAVAHKNPPYVTVYSWSGAGFGAKFQNPTEALQGGCGAIQFSPAGDRVFAMERTEAGICSYAWSSSGFGPKSTLVSPLPAKPSFGGGSLALDPIGSGIAASRHEVYFLDEQPAAKLYRWTGNGVGWLQDAPLTSLLSSGTGVAFSPDGAALAVATGTGPSYFSSTYGNGKSGLGVFGWSAQGLGAMFPFPNSGLIYSHPWYSEVFTHPGYGAIDTKFNSKGDAIAFSPISSPYLIAHRWSAAGFGPPFAFPDPAPLTSCSSIAFGVIR